MRRQGGQHTLQTFLHLLTSWERGPLARLVLSPGRAALLPAWFFLLGARASCPPGFCGLEARTPREGQPALLLIHHVQLPTKHWSSSDQSTILTYRVPSFIVLLFSWERGHLARLAFAGWKPALPGGMDSSRPAPDKALIFVRPVNHLDVPDAFFHRPSLLLGARASCPPCLCGLEARTPRGDGFITSSSRQSTGLRQTSQPS